MATKAKKTKTTKTKKRKTTKTKIAFAFMKSNLLNDSVKVIKATETTKTKKQIIDFYGKKYNMKFGVGKHINNCVVYSARKSPYDYVLSFAK